MPTLEDFLSHPIETLEKALHLKKQIGALQDELAELFGSNPPALAGVQIFEEKRRGRPKGKKMSAASRARMAAGQRARWAAKKGTGAIEPAAPVVEAKKEKGGMSAAGRARIATAQKLRWAKAQ
jgi:hypothetical protein